MKLNPMVKEIKDNLLIRLLPDEKLLEEAKTGDDQRIILGWNLYREKLLKRLKLTKGE